jgi:hypothetical protein
LVRIALEHKAKERRMNRVEAEKIFSVMSRNESKGIAIFSLENETHIDINKLHRYLTQYPEFFCRVANEPRYTINRLGPFKGAKNQMLEEVERLQLKKMQMVALLPIWVSVMLGGWFFIAG